MKMVKEPLKLRSTGELIGAPFGFANTFLHMFGELTPTHVIVTLDTAGPTFRHEITDTYKATRVGMPAEEREEFSRQMKRCREVIETFGMPIFELEGYEADDIMGALSVQGAKEGIDTFLVSMDSDIAQLVTPEVHMWMYRPYQRDSVIFKGPEDVRDRYGVLPEQIADLKALKGDTSDNIPGIPGVGEKTAIKLVQRFGSVEAMLDNPDAIEPAKLQTAVREAADQIRQSKRLAVIDSAAPVNLDLRAADFYAHYDRSNVTKFFQEMEFRTLISRLPEPTGRVALQAEGEGTTPAETRVSLIDSEDALDELVGRIVKEKSFVLDTETTTREAMRADLVGLSVALGDGAAYYIPTGHAPRLGENGQLPVDAVLAKLAPLIEDPKIEKTGHYLKYDMVVLARHGIWAQGIGFDTMIAAHLLGEGGGAGRPEEGSLALGWLGARRLGIELQDRNALLNPSNKRSATITWDKVDINAAGQCAGACADAIAGLRAVLEPELDEKGMRRLFDEVEMPLVSVLARMELNGVAIDTGALHEMSESLTMEIRRIEQDIYDSVGHEFNIGSPIQLSQILFEELLLPKTRRLKTGAYSTDAQSLEGLRGLHEIVDHIYAYRELTKLKSTYLDTLPYLVNPQTHRIHTEFNQTGAATGRLASSNPNLMNIPVRTELGEQIRRSFIARDVGPEPMLLAADYSQIELRIVAHMTEDPGLIEAFRNDDDIHAATAARVFNVPIAEVTANMRRRAKVFNFGVLYGLSDYGLSVREKISREEAGEFIRTYFEKYPGMQRYVSETIQRVREYGYVETLFGRRRYIPEIHSTNFNVRNAAERAAVNMPVQGTAADIIKIAMDRLDAEMQRRKVRSLMTLQIHDELMFECPMEELEDMRRLCLDIMPRSLEMKVPLKVETKTGRNWGEMQYGEKVELGELTGA